MLLKSVFSRSVPAALAAAALLALPASAPAQGSGHEATAELLGEGGDFYLYINAEFFQKEMRRKIENFVMAAGERDLTTFGVAFDAFMEESGLASVSDIGVSAGPASDGTRRETCALLHSGEAKGLFSILGGEPHASAALNYAPADTLVFESLDLNGEKALTALRRGVSRVGGAEAVAEMQQGMAEIRRETGVNVERLVRSLDGEVAVMASLDESREVLMADWNKPLATIAMPRFAFMAEIDGASLFKAMARMMPELIAREGEGGTRVASFAEGSHFDDYVYQPGVAWDGKFLIVATDKAWLETILATSRGEGERLADTDAYKETLAGLPSEGNGFGFVHARAIEAAADFFDQAIDNTSSQDSWHDPAAEIRAIKEMMGLNAEPIHGAHVRVNLDKGFKLTRVGLVDFDDVINSVTGGGFATMVAFAVPEMASDVDDFATRQVQADLKRIDDANQEYAIEHNLDEGDPLPSIEELVDMGYLRAMPQAPEGGSYVQAKQVAGPGDWANPDAYPSFDGPNPNGDRVHPSLVEYMEAKDIEAVSWDDGSMMTDIEFNDAPASRPSDDD